jgi:2,4-dienoyl-CoA reductase (NADPH2)
LGQGIEARKLRRLFTPITIGNLRLANRIVMPAIHLSYTPNGFVTDTLVDFYVERAPGGVSLIIVGGCPVDEYGGGPFMIGLNDDEFVPALRRLTEAAHEAERPCRNARPHWRRQEATQGIRCHA